MMGIETIKFIFCALFLLGGMLILLASAIGNYRFRNSLDRMHAAAMGDSMGKLCVCLGLILYRWGKPDVWKLLFILAFFWMAGPVCTHMLALLNVTVSTKRKENAQDGDDV